MKKIFRDKKGRFIKKCDCKDYIMAEIKDEKENVRKIIETPINLCSESTVSLPSGWGNKSTTVKRIKPTVQYRKTQEEIEKENGNKAETKIWLNSIASEVGPATDKYMSDTLWNEFKNKLNIKSQSLEIDAVNKNFIDAIINSDEYKNALSIVPDKIIKKIIKLKKNQYKKLKKKYGKKVAKMLLFNTQESIKNYWKFEKCTSKKLEKKIEEIRNRIDKEEKIEEVELPRVAAHDLSMNKNTSMIDEISETF